MKQFIRRRLTYADIFLILANLVPVAGVWLGQWSATEAFIVYCLESVIAGAYNVVMMLVVTQIKKKDVWQNGNYTAMVRGYWFILFFMMHYGFFVWLQIGIFLDVSRYGNGAFGPFNVFSFFAHLTRNIPVHVQWVLLAFIVSNGLLVLKNFVLPGVYKTASLGMLMFAPYARIFVQQFCVIIGAFLLRFGGGGIFILVFACVKIFFETVLDYDKMITESAKQSSVAERSYKK